MRNVAGKIFKLAAAVVLLALTIGATGNPDPARTGSANNGGTSGSPSGNGSDGASSGSGCSR